MNVIIRLYVVLFVFIASTANGQVNKSLAGTIDNLYEADQTVQLRLLEMNQHKAPQDSMEKQYSLKRAMYKRNLQVIKKIYAQYGYPTITLVGADASHHFFILIQHADSEPHFQLEMLPILDSLSQKGDILRKDYAYLYDRVQHNTGGKQRYGTQPAYGENGSLFDKNNRIIYPPDLEDPENVDARRKEAGMEPIEQYYESVLQLLGRPRAKPKQ
ncbi:DUF6624 domain-containing protein [Chitinophaga sp. HK235]|uniref:DUF6624 domain-containing protein n=1 Tax=Chitinophaga sp. HK235 TaxID=2952571 RepID=UPI001BAC1CF4|nr:DUF6624 domain-containing protein [Chitinophaga sp. HK235]